VQADRLKDRTEFVIAILSFPKHTKSQIDLSEGWKF